MGSTDFFDDDLGRQRDAMRRIKLGDQPIGVVSDLSSSDEVPVRPLSDLSLTRMAKHKQNVDENATMAAQELERLRKRQEEVEREKRELEDIRRKQEEYERGKREMLEKIGQSLVTMEKDEMQAERLAEILSACRKQFKEMLAELEGVNEELWHEEKFGEELNKALALIEDTRMEYSKSLSKIEAAGGAQPHVLPAALPGADEYRGRRAEEQPFSYWLKVGFAVTLPLVVVVILVAAIVIVMQMTYVM